MGKMGKCNFADLEKFKDRLDKLSEQQTKLFMEQCAKALATRLLAKVIKRTPVGDYTKNLYVDTKNKSVKYVGFKTKEGKQVAFRVKSIKKGGTLRRGWTGGKNSNAMDYASSLKVINSGGIYIIDIINPTEYATYVEFGHRTKNHKGWVKGVFMLTISEEEVRAAAPAILEKKLMQKLEECFG